MKDVIKFLTTKEVSNSDVGSEKGVPHSNLELVGEIRESFLLHKTCREDKTNFFAFSLVKIHSCFYAGCIS